MNFSDLASMFNRAIVRSLGIKKLLIVFLLLIFAGMVFLFFQGIALYVPDWLSPFLKLTPLFIALGFLLGAGALICQIYLHEREGETDLFQNILSSSWETMLRASYFAIPFLLAYIALSLLIGVFILLKSIPLLGVFFGIIFSFVPMILSLCIVLLFLGALGMCFFFTPSFVVKKEFNHKNLIHRLTRDPFTNLLLLGTAFAAVWIVWSIAVKAVGLTLATYSFEDLPAVRVLQTFFMLLPFMAFLTPAVIFFFNFATEVFLREEEG